MCNAFLATSGCRLHCPRPVQQVQHQPDNDKFHRHPLARPSVRTSTGELRSRSSALCIALIRVQKSWGRQPPRSSARTPAQRACVYSCSGYTRPVHLLCPGPTCVVSVLWEPCLLTAQASVRALASAKIRRLVSVFPKIGPKNQGEPSGLQIVPSIACKGLQGEKREACVAD